MSVKDIVGKEQLEAVTKGSEKLVLIDFWAEWCGPCRMLWPVLHDLGEKYADKIEVVKVNVDEDDNQALSMEYGVRSIPQVTIIKAGEQVDQFVGALPPDQVEAYIAKHIA